MLPIEQTKLMIATMGADDRAPQLGERAGDQ
jgi:hypothetical protein